MIKVCHEYNGMIDYWGGNGRRWDADAGCLFVPFGPDTTLADIVDGLVDDYNGGGDCDEFPPEVSGEMIREAIMTTMYNAQGRADVASGALYEGAAYLRADIGYDRCRECKAWVGEGHEEDCAILKVLKDSGEYEEDADAVIEEDCPNSDDCDDWDESPVFVALVEVDVCPECGAYVEDPDANDDGICDACSYWTLCQNDTEDDDGWVWVGRKGEEVGPFATDCEAMANHPDKEGRGIIPPLRSGGCDGK